MDARPGTRRVGPAGAGYDWRQTLRDGRAGEWRLVLISRPHYWPGRFAALLAKSRWVEREAARYQQTIADDETARLARAGIDLAALDEPPA